MKNYTKTKIGNEARVELHDKLALTGAEVSINQLPAGAGELPRRLHRRGCDRLLRNRKLPFSGACGYCPCAHFAL